MFKSLKSGVFTACFLMVCVAVSPSVANAAGGDVEISLRLHGGMSYLQAKDVNAGAGGYFDYFEILGALGGYTKEGEEGFSPLHDGYDFGADLVIQVHRNIGIGIGAGYLKSTENSVMTLTSPEETVTVNGMTKLSALPIRLGVFLTLPLNDKLNFTANAGAAWYTSLKFTADLRLEADTDWEQISLDSSRTSFSDIGFQGGLGFEYKVVPNVGLFVEALGRYARFKNFDSVTGTESYSGGDPDSMEGKLYLETFTEDELSVTLFTLEETPPVSEPPDYLVREPKFDFSGFCLQAGFRIRF